VIDAIGFAGFLLQMRLNCHPFKCLPVFLSLVGFCDLAACQPGQPRSPAAEPRELKAAREMRHQIEGFLDAPDAAGLAGGTSGVSANRSFPFLWQAD
jgi:hypothetical protein